MIEYKFNRIIHNNIDTIRLTQLTQIMQLTQLTKPPQLTQPTQLT